MPMYSTELANTDVNGVHGNIRRSSNPTEHPQLGIKGCMTLYEVIRRGELINPLGPCLGFRATSTDGQATPFMFHSYTECLSRINCIAAGLKQLNLLEKNEDGMLLLALQMQNCMEWVISEHAAYTIGGATVPLYDTLGPDTTKFILQQTSTKSVVCSRKELPNLCKVKKSGECPFFEYAILIDGVVPSAIKLSDESGLKVISLAKVEAIGSQYIASHENQSEKFSYHNPPAPKDIATFCYTSGTTGNPKGAMISHENLISAIAGMTAVFVPAPYDRHLSYLPLAHIFERVIMCQILYSGASVGFFRGNPLLLIEDIQTLRPTIIPVAPRVLNKIHDKVMTGITAAGGLKQKLFNAALKTKRHNLMAHGQLKHKLYDTLIFNKLKKALGMDCLRIMVSGSAPLSDNVMTFFRCMLGVPVVEGYGQTEGTAAATVSAIEDMSSIGHVGGPISSCEVCLFDVPEMGYTSADTSHRNGQQKCHGRGEVCIRGPNVFMGYYKDDVKTKEAIDSEGWLHSGDIGLWTEDGQLQIIDRKKNIFKLSQGEYVAPEKIENILIRSNLIGQCFVYGDSKESCLVGIVILDEEFVRNKYNSNDNSQPFADVCKTNENEIRNSVMDDIKTLSKANKLNGFETVKDIYIDYQTVGGFTVDNGLVTPTFKLKRQQLRDYYESHIQEMYKNIALKQSSTQTSKL